MAGNRGNSQIGNLGYITFIDIAERLFKPGASEHHLWSTQDKHKHLHISHLTGT